MLRLSPKLPAAALLALGLCALASVACLVGSRLRVYSDKKLVILIGDSFTGNYRFEEGERLEDLLSRELGGSYQVFNLARPGAHSLDILLQIHRAETILGDIDAIVLPLFVDKLLVDDPSKYVRLDKRGNNLKWLKISNASLGALATFDGELFRKLVIHKLGLVFGFYDTLEEEFVEHVQSPIERAQMREDPPERRQAIQKKIRSWAAYWDAITTAEMSLETDAARDMALAIDYAQREGIPLMVVLIPTGDMEAVRAEFSPRAKANLEAVRRAIIAWCQRHRLSYVDLTDRLPGAYYDDFTHLKAVAGNEIVVHAVGSFIRNAAATKVARREE